ARRGSGRCAPGAAPCCGTARCGGCSGRSLPRLAPASPPAWARRRTGPGPPRSRRGGSPARGAGRRPAAGTASRTPAPSSVRDRARRVARRIRAASWDSSAIGSAVVATLVRGQPLAGTTHGGLDHRPPARGLLVFAGVGVRAFGGQLLREPAREPPLLVLPLAHQAPAASLVARPGGPGIVIRPGGQGGRRLDQDAVGGTGRHAQLAAGAERRQHRVHALAGADDRVDRAGLYALGATDAIGRHDPGDRPRLLGPARRVECERLAPEGGGEAGDPPAATGRTAVDGRAV